MVNVYVKDVEDGVGMLRGNGRMIFTGESFIFFALGILRGKVI